MCPSSCSTDTSCTPRRRVRPTPTWPAKAALYASGEIPDYWVVDLTDDRIVVHRDPSGSLFRSVTSHDHGILRPLHHPHAHVDVTALLR